MQCDICAARYLMGI